jgi:hypothetical protein
MDERTDGQTDLKNLIVAFRNFKNAPKNNQKFKSYMDICENEVGRCDVWVKAAAGDFAERWFNWDLTCYIAMLNKIIQDHNTNTQAAVKPPAAVYKQRYFWFKLNYFQQTALNGIIRFQYVV